MFSYQRGVYYNSFETKSEIVGLLGFICDACGHSRAINAHVEEDPCEECECKVDTYILDALHKSRPARMPPNCGCMCHSVPGVSHVAACCGAPPVDF